MGYKPSLITDDTTQITGTRATSVLRLGWRRKAMARAATGLLVLGVLLLCLTASSHGSRGLLQSLTSVPTGGNGGTFSSTPGGASERATSRAGNNTETANTAPARQGLIGGGGLVQTNLGSSSTFQCVTAACARG
ncbi:g10979 [Coccomyxa elongata]